ncbi:MAG: response regulator [bacterium]|nr:response regulator [bacterium]
METKNSVLVVDDELEICKMLKMLFEKKWYEVSYVMTGKEAIEKITKRKFNVALLDINLPDIEGTELIPIFKKVHPDIKIVMMTGQATKDNTMRALNNGASYYFEKPFNIDELLTKTQELVEQQNKTSSQTILQESARSMNVRDIANPDKQDVSLAPVLPFKIRKAIEYIEKNYTNPELSLKEIARSVGMQFKGFSFLWNKTTKIKIRGYINGLRIEKAKELLLDPTLYVAQIAYKTGLPKHHFCKVFKDKIGYSPTEYRKFFPNI